MSDKDKERCRHDNGWFEEKIQEYLEQHLSININRRHGYYNDVTLKVSITLNGKEISSSTEYL